MKKALTLILVCAMAFSAVSLSAAAKKTTAKKTTTAKTTTTKTAPKVEPVVLAPDETPAIVWMGGYILFRMRCSAGGLTPQQRADVIQERVNALIGWDGFDTRTVVTKSLPGGSAAVYANNKILVEIDKRTAALNGETPLQLANSWAKNVKMIYPKACPRID